ncbi:MAG: hypothetical protein J5492_00850 [Oxalobacter sp.]|nr:hypothetical protein [Oxalobacter sp.]
MTYSVSRFLRNTALLALATTSIAWAAPSSEDIIKNHFKTYLGQTPDEVRKTDYGNLYEVRIGTDIVYSDPNGLYLIAGNVTVLHFTPSEPRQVTLYLSKVDNVGDIVGEIKLVVLAHQRQEGHKEDAAEKYKLFSFHFVSVVVVKVLTIRLHPTPGCQSPCSVHPKCLVLD